jgi:hypothetical protein
VPSLIVGALSVVQNDLGAVSTSTPRQVHNKITVIRHSATCQYREWASYKRQGVRPYIMPPSSIQRVAPCTGPSTSPAPGPAFLGMQRYCPVPSFLIVTNFESSRGAKKVHWQSGYGYRYGPYAKISAYLLKGGTIGPRCDN